MKLTRKTAGLHSFEPILAFALLAWLTPPLLPAATRAAETSAPKQVLVLYWYGKDFPANVELEKGLQTAFRSGAGEYFAEYLESNRFPGESHSLALRDYLRQKYADNRIDVIISMSSPALEFLLKYRNDLLPDTPIVYHLNKPLDLGNRDVGPGITGVVVDSVYQNTLNLALRLHPRTEQVFIITGTPLRNKALETEVRKDLKEFESRATLTYLTDLPPEELIARVKSAPERSVILYIRHSQDEPGKTLDPGDILALVAQSANVPVYGVASYYLGRGGVGGYAINIEACGTRAAEVALRIANGARPQDIPVVEVPSIPMFDWRQLKRWGISEDRLPPGSIIYFREPSFWEQYKRRIIAVFALVAVQTLLIAFLLLERDRRMRAKAALDEELRFQTLLSELSAEFTSLPAGEVEPGIDKWANRLGQFFGVDGGAFIELTENKAVAGVNHPDTHASFGSALTSIPDEQLQWCLDQLRRGVTVILPDVPPKKATNWKRDGGRVGFKSLLAIPVSVGDSMWALMFMTLKSYRVWPKDLVPRLRLAGEIFADAVVRKIAEEGLTREKLFSDTTIDSLPGIFYHYDENGHFIRWNENFERVTGYSHEEIAVMHPLDFFAGSDRRLIEERIGEVFNSGEASAEADLICKDGRAIPYFFTGRRVLIEGKPFLIGTGIDIEERMKAEEALQQLTSRLLQLQDEERRRIARELHDVTAQNLFAITINLARLREGFPLSPEVKDLLAECYTLGKESQKEIRTFSYLLHPPMLDEAGLVQALQWYVEGFTRRSGIDVDLVVMPDVERLSSEVEIALFRIVQESLTNIHRHSGSDTASIRFEKQADQIVLQILDHGRGMTARNRSKEIPDTFSLGVGIPGMRQRLIQLGGTLDIKSSDQGTVITAIVPLTNKREVKHDSHSAGR